MNRKATIAIALAIASIVSFATTAKAAPPSVDPDGAWIRTNDEAGWAFRSATFGVPFKSTAPVDVKPLAVGDISDDGRYVHFGEGGWQIRPAEYRLRNGRFVRVDDSAGPTPPLAASHATTDELRTTAGRLGGG